MLLSALTVAALAAWPNLQTIHVTQADEHVRQVTLAVDDSVPEAWFLFDVWDTTDTQAYLYGRSWDGSDFDPDPGDPPAPVSEDIAPANTSTYNASVAVFDDGTSEVFATARFTNTSWSNLQELVMNRTLSTVTPEADIADDRASSAAVGRNMIVVDETNGLVGACWVEDCDPEDEECDAEDTYASARSETGYWPASSTLIAGGPGKQEHCTTAFEEIGDEQVVAWGTGNDIKVRTSEGTATFSAGITYEFEQPAVAVTMIVGDETVQVVAIDKAPTPDQLRYFSCVPSDPNTDCADSGDWMSFANSSAGVSRPQVASSDDGYLFVAFLDKSGSDDRMRVTWVCPGGGTFESPSLVDGGTGSGNDEAVVVTSAGANVYDGVAFNNLAVDEATIGLYTGWVHVAYLTDTDSGAGVEWTPKVASKPMSTFGCTP